MSDLKAIAWALVINVVFGTIWVTAYNVTTTPEQRAQQAAEQAYWDKYGY